MPKQTAFGIDFGTTNTRVAYYDGQRLRMVPFITAAGQSFQLPTLVSYRNGEPVAYGAEARRQQHGVLPPRPLKWLLGGDLPIEVEGSKLEPVEIVADFFRHLKQLVGKAVKAEPLNRAALTIPVHYPPKAREQLQEACEKANIKVTNFFFEPIAAIYCSLTARPVSGVTAVFDWGGGSLDIATVQITGSVAMTRQIDGWHRGGSDFDRAICEQAVNDFLLRQPQIQYTADVILDRMTIGRNLRLLAETAKERLTTAQQASLSYGGFLGSANLLYPITRDQFEALIETDIVGAVTRLDHALHATGTSPKLLARLFLSGGTCNIPRIKDCLAGRFGERIVSRLELPPALRHVGVGSDGTNDIGNATAMGAALLAVHGAEPVFSNAVGVRLADAADDHFYPVFQAGERLTFDRKEVKFFVSDASSGVARLLICDQSDPVLQPAGRLLRIVPVPIDKNETWLKVGFTLDRHLVLKIEASGVKVRAQATDPVWIQHLSLGFHLPTQAAAAAQPTRASVLAAL
jgi:molecular chaperone DnaK